MNEDNPMTTEEESTRNVLADFMGKLQEWESTIEGTPTAKELDELDSIYHDAFLHLSVILKETN
jgi:hypothetical protein